MTISSGQQWVLRSNDNARILLDLLGKFTPEHAGMVGASVFDTDVFDLAPELWQRMRRGYQAAETELTLRLQGEEDPPVRQDLKILLHEAGNRLRALDLAERYDIPYWNVAGIVHAGIHALLKEQIPPQRRPAALVRLRRYVGEEEGYRPLAELAAERSRERLHIPGLSAPFRGEVEKDLSRCGFFVEGVKGLLEKEGLAGWEPLQERLQERLQEQLVRYGEFVRGEILPRCRDDFRLPPEVYRFRLREFGIDLSPEELSESGRRGFAAIREKMEQMAPRVAQRLGAPGSGYPELLARLRSEQLSTAGIIEVYRERARVIEEIIRREEIVSLPDYPMIIRLATPAEAAAIPAPHMRPPPLVENRGEQGEFVLPAAVPGEEGMNRLEDFTFDAIAWMLTAHEGRPGHELQFATMVAKGVSLARALFAFNSVNAEGWALYAETLVQEFMPLEAQLTALQFQLLRAARAFIDPELQTGRMTPQEAMRILTEEVVLTEAYAREEVDRYTFFLPGQAPSYFYGYTRLKELRREVEEAMGERFRQQGFHDFILSQGLVPPDLLAERVREEFLSDGVGGLR